MNPSRLICCSALFFGLSTPQPAFAAANGWTKPTSGNWEEQAYWSLGVLPDATQDILFTNAGWKALAIGNNTAQNFPQSMQVQAVSLSAPTDSFNTLLLNFAGFERPLQTTALIVGTNSSVIVLSSALQDSGDLIVSGTFNQGDYSEVKVHGSVIVGLSYFLTNGTLSVEGFNHDAAERISGGFQGYGRFVQYGGFNDVGSLQVSINGEFDLYGGEVNATNGITVGLGDYATLASFYQYAGNVNADTVINGNYFLNGGQVTGHMSVVSPTYQRVDAFMLQSGGTNSATSFDLGYPNRFGGRAFYVLSNGVVKVDSSTTFRGGEFSQYNGQHTIVSNLFLLGTDLGFNFGFARADYFLWGGTLSAGGLTIQASTLQQNGGTNAIAGTIEITGDLPHTTEAIQMPLYNLTGGLLSASNIIVSPFFGGFKQTGGTNQITGKLTVAGTNFGGFQYSLEGGALVVKDILVSSNGFFQHANGNIVHSGLLTLNQGGWRAATGDRSLGPLLLTGGADTNSTISFPDGSSILRLANSSAQPWDSSAVLYIANWHGSASGGGDTQLLFGSAGSGLTSQQLALIRFSISGGLYPAQILSTGEVVPTAGPVEGLTNDWTKATSGGWEEPYWSLGIMPASNQTVHIDNAGFKAVGITSSTVSNFPASLTVSNLVVAAPTNGLNTLLLNYTGLGTPLKVLNACTIGTNGTIANFESNFEVDGGAGTGLIIDGGTFTQLGGFTSVNAPVMVRSGSFNSTNANMILGDVTLGTTNTAGTFNQNGGSPLVQKLSIVNGRYTLNSGILYAIGGTQIDFFGEFLQWNGTNYGDITVNAPSSGAYTMDGGMIQGNVLTVRGSFYQGDGLVDVETIDWTGNNGNVLLHGTLRSKVLNIHASALLYMGVGYAPDFMPGSVETESLTISNSAHVSVNGYDLFVTNSLDIRGDATNSSAHLNLVSSMVRVGAFTLHDYSQVEQYGPEGTTKLATGLLMDGGQYLLEGGLLEGPSIGVGANATFTQRFSGTNLVHGILSITGTYDLSAGTLVTDGISLRGSLLLSDPQSSGFVTSFTNKGVIDLGGFLSTRWSNAWPGQVQLSTNANIVFSGAPAQLHFAASSAMLWNSSAHLTISNWNNSGNLRVFFGSSASGLTASQLSQITFVNPGGFPTGNYPARIQSSGEIIPAVLPPLAFTSNPDALILSWTGNYQLLTATNVAGPYDPIPEATSPFTNAFVDPQRFFRLGLAAP